MSKSNLIFYYLQQACLLIVMLLGIGYSWYYKNILMLIFVGIVYISFNLLRMKKVIEGGKG